MDLSHPATLLVPAGIGLLIAWRVVARVRRMVGRQRLSPVRPWLTVVLLPLLMLALLLRSVAHPMSALALLAGVLAGVALGVWGLRLTKFEPTPQGWYFTPNLHLGIALSLLLVARLGYRAVQVYLAAESFRDGSVAFLRSPLTLLIFGTLAGYYVSYAVGLLRWRHGAAVAAPAQVTDPAP